jgi:hypothetical protein
MLKHRNYKISVEYTDSSGKHQSEVIHCMGKDRDQAMAHARMAARHEGWKKVKFSHVTLQ